MGNQGVAPAMMAFDLSPRMIRKGVTVLRLTSIDKLTGLELYLSVPRLAQLQNNRHSLQQIITSLHSLPGSDEHLHLIQTFDTCT